ncbi:MAG: 6-carboxytetrahydropterin synthase QueD [Candidatus Omnitrophota bacterium]|nr:6-carboxytetrahydropterin synthase QueD [Candidatus Omnitrophota bacterium]
MFSIKIESYFSSAHFLRGYKGKCEKLHGHNWKVEFSVEAEKTDKIGMVLDFKDLKMELNKVLEKLDHKCLNRLAYFKKVNPTSENIARYIYKSLKSELPGIKLVTVWESHNCCASYYEG